MARLVPEGRTLEWEEGLARDRALENPDCVGPEYPAGAVPGQAPPVLEDREEAVQGFPGSAWAPGSFRKGT